MKPVSYTHLFAPNIAEVKSSGADTIMFSAEYNNLAAFAQQLRKTDTDTQIIGLMTTYNGELIKLAGDTVNGMYLYSCFDPNSDSAVVQQFVKEYSDANGMQPDFVAANAYDSVYMLKNAIAVSYTHLKIENTHISLGIAGRHIECAGHAGVASGLLHHDLADPVVVIVQVLHLLRHGIALNLRSAAYDVAGGTSCCVGLDDF